MQLEVGKKYRTRDGKTVVRCNTEKGFAGVLIECEVLETLNPLVKVGECLLYSYIGTFDSVYYEHYNDLVEEVI